MLHGTPSKTMDPPTDDSLVQQRLSVTASIPRGFRGHTRAHKSQAGSNRARVWRVAVVFPATHAGDKRGACSAVAAQQTEAGSHGTADSADPARCRARMIGIWPKDEDGWSDLTRDASRFWILRFTGTSADSNNLFGADVSSVVAYAE